MDDANLVIIGGAETVEGESHLEPTASTLRPLAVIRRRLESAGVWSQLCVALVQQHPDKLLTLLSTDTLGMVDVTDQDVIEMVMLVGADPAVILA